MSELQMLIEEIGGVLSAEQVLQMLQYKLDKIQQVGHNLRAFCPIHKDDFLRTLNVDPNRKSFNCNYAKCKGHKGGSLFELYKLSQEMTDLEAAKYLAEILGIEIHSSLVDATEEDIAAENAKEHDITASNTEGLDPEMLELLRVPSDVESEQMLTALVDDAVHGLEEDFIPEDEDEQTPAEAVAASEEDDGEAVEIDVDEGIEGASAEIILEALQPEKVVEEAPAIPPAEPAVVEPGPETSKDHLNWESLYQEGVSLFEGNRYGQAESKLLEAMTVAPSDAERARVILTLGKCYLETQKPAETIELLEDGLEMADLMAPIHKAMLKLLSNAYERKGNLPKSAEILRTLISKYGDDPEATNKLKNIEEAVASQNSSSPQERRISFL